MHASVSLKGERHPVIGGHTCPFLSLFVLTDWWCTHRRTALVLVYLYTFDWFVAQMPCLVHLEKTFREIFLQL